MKNMRPSGEPIYLQIARILREEIDNNHVPGDRLESEGKIADRFNVNRHTLRRAIDELVDQGYLERRRGLGVFVFERPLKYELHSETRVTTNLLRMGVTGERTFFRRSVESASREVAEQLKIRKGQKVAALESLVQANKMPLCVSTHYFVHAAHHEIYDSFQNGSLHQFLTKTYNISIKRKTSVITALLPTSEEAGLLRSALNQPILRISSVNIDIKGHKPVEYVITRFRADRVDLTIDYEALG